MKKRFSILLFPLSACIPADEVDGTGGTKAAEATHVIDPVSFCNRYITECKMEKTVGVQECIDQYTPARVTPACATKIESATCSDFDATFIDLCFPKCSARGDTCSDDNSKITSCDGSLRTHVYACESVCKVQNLRYSGTCGTIYLGDVSETPKCWCTL